MSVANQTSLEKITPDSAVYALESAICNLPQVVFPLVHHFSKGLYAREMTIPAGGIAVGAVHKTEHLATISAGTIMIMTDEGVKTLSAPCTFKSNAGIKRAAYALSETVLTTYHVTNETDLDKLVEELCTSTNDELVGGKNNLQLIANKKMELK